MRDRTRSASLVRTAGRRTNPGVPELHLTYDSSFVIAGYDVNRTWLLPLVRDSLGFSTLVTYTIPTTLDSQAIWNPADSNPRITRTIIDYLFDSMGTGGSSPALRIMGVPSTISGLSKNASSMEAYPLVIADTLQAQNFSDVASVGSPILDFISTHFVGGHKVDAYPGGTYSTVVDRPRFTQRAFRDPDRNTYALLDTIYGGHAQRPGDDAAGVYQRLADAIPGYADSSHLYYLEVTVRLPDVADSLADSTALFVVTLFRRDTLMQMHPGGCLCNIVTPFKQLTIRKRDLEGEIDEAGDGYQRFGVWFSGIWAVVGGDTLWISPAFGKPAIVAGVGPNDTLAPRCDTLLATRRSIADTTSPYWLPATAQNLATTSLAEESFVSYRVETTGATSVMMLRGAINSHLYQALRRGTTDTLIRRDIYPFATDARLNAAVSSIGVMDEPHLETLRSFGETSRRIQAARSDVLPSDPRPTFAPVYANYDGLRVFSNDFDTTSKKTLQTIIEDQYLVGREPIPVTYANPSLMSEEGTRYLYGMSLPDAVEKGAIVRRRLVSGNSDADYAWFTKVTQERFGSFAGRRLRRTTVGNGGPWLENLARAVDVTRFKYADRGPSTPVYALVDVNAWINIVKVNGVDVYEKHFAKRPPTPEEIRCQAWLSRNLGTNGLVFSQMTAVGPAIGPLRVDSLHRMAPYDGDYDSLVDYKCTTCRLDRAWFGFRARYEAIREVSRALRYIDSVVGWNNLIYAQEQMSVHDVTMSFDDMPLVAWLGAERAIPDSVTVQGYGTPDFDDREETYIELTHFRPADGDSLAKRAGSRYLLVTSRRLYPPDFTVYADSVRELFENVAKPADELVDYRNAGLGNIDVRRPHIVLKNDQELLADEFLIERIDENGWSTVATAGDSVPLQWLMPGEGALYRVTPQGARGSSLATAYPNGVKSVNVERAVPTEAGNYFGVRRVIVYERDSVIFLKRQRSDGSWSDEMTVSDEGDTMHIAGVRRAHNFNPSIAAAITAPNGDIGYILNLMVVWERHASNGTADVLGRIYRSGGISDTTTVSGLLGGAVTTAQLDARGIRMTPVTVGVPAHDTVMGDGGFAIAWATPSRQIHTRFVNANTGYLSALASPIRSTAIRSLTSDTVACWPTIAYGGTRFDSVSGHAAIDLAFQQGRGGVNPSRIIYCRLRLDTLTPGVDGIADPRRIVGQASEHVTQGVAGCSFEHPSIASDPLQTGVAFEIVGLSRSIGLRFRDTTYANGAAAAPWQRFTYRWGRRDTLTYSLDRRQYGWPSLVQFAGVDRTQLLPAPLGAIAWQWANTAGGLRNRQQQYFYGHRNTQELPNGQFAGMTLAPFVDTAATAMAATSAFYRGYTDEKVLGTNPDGIPAWYYPLYVREPRNTALMSGPPGGAIHMSFQVKGVGEYPCTALYGSIGAGLVLPPISPRTPGIMPKEPTQPPSFFAAPGIGTPLASEALLNEDVARSGVFEVASDTVFVRRMIIGNDSLLGWLNTPAFNPGGRPPADIAMITELVDAADSAILWQADTVWARNVTGVVLDEQVPIPVGDVANAGDTVYVRLRSIVSTGIIYETDREMAFFEDTMSIVLGKPQKPQRRRVLSKEESAVPSMTITPNPTSGSIRLRIQASPDSDARIRVHDLLGLIRAIETRVRIGVSGAAELELDMTALGNGTYVLEVTGIAGTSTAQFSIVR